MFRKGIVLLIVGAVWPCFAKMDLPPVLRTAEEVEKFAAQIRFLVPEVGRGSKAIEVAGQRSGLMDILGKEQALVKQLRSLPQYMELAEQRPPLQVLTFRLVQPNGERTDSKSNWKTFRNWYLTHFSLGVSPIHSLRANLLHWPKRSSTGFFSAWVGLLSESQRSILKDPDVRSRWHKLSSILGRMTIEKLRSQLKPEAFGMGPHWTWSELNQVAEQIAAFEDLLVNLVQSFKPDSDPEDAVWLTDENWGSWLAPYDIPAKDMAQLKALRSRVVKRFWDLTSDAKTESVMRHLVLRELPPYLAVYRGCVGGDCSTSHSWPFPYSPTERNWWIEDESGQHLGYVSGAITEVGGQSNLYIRDVTGPELRRGDIAVILHGFYMARAFFGAETMTIMNSTFTAQNHFLIQVQELQDFGGDFMETVEQVFTDRWVREQYLRPLQSGPYDDVEKHTNVRLMSPKDPDLARIRVERWSTAKNANGKNPHFLWSLLADAVRRRDGRMLEALRPGYSDWMDFVKVLLNEDQLPVSDYYTRLESVFQEKELPFSRNLVRKYEHVFMPGHLSAPDAFLDERGRKQSIRYLENLIWRLGGAEMGYQLVAEHLAVLERDPNWIETVQPIFERRGPEDISRLNGLWGAGYRFLNASLSRHDFMWILEVTYDVEMADWALRMMDGERITAEGATILAGKLGNEDERIPESISEWAAKKILGQNGLADLSDSLRAEMVVSMETDDNLKITIPLALAFLRDVPADHHFYKNALNLLRQNQGNDQLSPDLKRRIHGALSRLASDESCEDNLRPRNRR